MNEGGEFRGWNEYQLRAELTSLKRVYRLIKQYRPQDREPLNWYEDRMNKIGQELVGREAKRKLGWY